MAEEFQNTISLYGPLDPVESSAQQLGAALFENIKNATTEEFILLWNSKEEPSCPQDILSEFLVDSIVFDESWAKISLAFQTRRRPFSVRILTALMTQYPEMYMEIETLGDCSGLIGILAREGKNLALRKLGLGSAPSKRSSLYSEFFCHIAWR